eukprot:1188994-Amphidinium_carterae.1
MQNSVKTTLAMLASSRSPCFGGGSVLLLLRVASGAESRCSVVQPRASIDHVVLPPAPWKQLQGNFVVTLHML